MGGTRLLSTVARIPVSPFIDHSQLRLLPPPVGGTPHSFQMIWSTRTGRAAVWTSSGCANRFY